MIGYESFEQVFLGSWLALLDQRIRHCLCRLLSKILDIEILVSDLIKVETDNVCGEKIGQQLES